MGVLRIADGLALDELVKAGPAFARHETFHPRYGWLKKGFEAARKDPEIFVRDEAPITLGVGKNMVRSIRYWCLAFKVLEETIELSTRRGQVHPTEFGRRMLSESDGFDPYTEEPATLWLLHWKLLSFPCKATAWYFTFNAFHRTDFSANEIATDLGQFIERVFPNLHTAPSSIHKDTSCLLRMYAEGSRAGLVLEESIDCPFSELGLVRTGTNKGQYRFAMGSKPSLPSAVIAACCLEYASTHSAETQTISLSSLLHGPGSPGQVFKLTEQSLYAALEEAAPSFRDLGLAEAAGAIQFTFAGSPKTIATKVLHNFYQGLKR
jgi:hypothetical protein